jgi:hypothetical protein
MHTLGEGDEMLTIEQILNAIDKRKKSQCLDRRDFSRLCQFVPRKDWPRLGFKFTEKGRPSKPIMLTEKNILIQLESDLAFGFEKALNCRGISSGLMYEVILMWLWILEDPLQHNDDNKNYAQYGLPLFKAVALKYGFPNPIGDDMGNESKYEEERWEEGE